MRAVKHDLLYITWRDQASDWPYFWLLKTKGDWLKLKGADYPDGSATHKGDVFMAHQADIKQILVIGEDCQGNENERLHKRIAELERGEYICKKCGLRKNDDYPPADF